MNAVEIEEAVSKLADAPFNAETFPYDFLQAFGLNDAGKRKLQSGDANKSDLPGGVLQRNKNNIHLLGCPPGEVAGAIDALRASAATVKHKARFILATDGQTIQAQRFDDVELLICDFTDLPNRFTFFLSLAGISTVKRIDENAFDIRATGRLNKLYVELLKENSAWDNDETLGRIYIGRRLGNDTERLEKLFELYTAMTSGNADVRVGTGPRRKKKPTGTSTLPGVGDA